MYFSGQGKLYYAIRDALGNPGAFTFAGNVPTLKVALTTGTTEHIESTDGQRLTDFRLITSKKAELSFDLEDWSLQNLAVGLYGSSIAPSTGATVTAEQVVAVGAVVAANQYVVLKNPNVSAVVLTDSTPTTPKTLVLGTDYTVNAQFGSIQLLNSLSTFILPIKAAYTYVADAGRVTMFSTQVPERWFRFEGLNTASQNAPVLVELYRAIIDPMKELDLINDKLLSMSMTGSALYDALRGTDPNFGNFGRVVFVQ